jgi:hypothetical protein
VTTRRVGVLVLATALTLGGVSCNKPDRDDPVESPYEDCEVSDQATREPDCGYSENAGTYRVGHHAQTGWTWHWWSWVVVGRDSSPPAGWVPPHGLQPPLEDGHSVKKTPKKIKEPVKPAPRTTTKRANTPTDGETTTKKRKRS